MRRIVLLGLCAAVLSCSFPFELRVVNGLARDVTVEGRGDDGSARAQRLAPGESALFALDSLFERGGLTIDVDGERVVYALPALKECPRDFRRWQVVEMRHGVIQRAELRVQLAPDLSLRLLAANQKWPAGDYVPQPACFPAEPGAAPLAAAPPARAAHATVPLP